MTQEFALYNIRRGPHGYQLGKFDKDLNLLAVYDTDTKYCTCPAGPRPTCRHRKMLPRMLAKVDTDSFYCYETNTWLRPLALEDEARQGSVTSQVQDANANEASSRQSEAPELYGKMDTTFVDAMRERNELMLKALKASDEQPAKDASPPPRQAQAEVVEQPQPPPPPRPSATIRRR